MEFTSPKVKFFFVPLFIILIAQQLSLWGYKTKNLIVEGKTWNEGQYRNTFINSDGNLQLTPQVSKMFSVTESVIWDVFHDGKYTWLATGSEGVVYSFYKSIERVKFQLPAQEITGIVKAEDFLYLGSGPEGKIFRIPTKISGDEGSENNFIWAETGEQFIWDMEVYKDDLWVATGGEMGKVFRIPLRVPSIIGNNLTPVLVMAEPNVLKINIKKIEGVVYLYAAVSTSGKLYRTDLNNIKKSKLEVLFDAGEKDITDFVFVEEDVYLITSGLGKAIKSSSVVDGSGETVGGNGDNVDIANEDSSENKGGLIDVGSLSAGLSSISDLISVGQSYENFLVKLGLDREVDFIYTFKEKNPIRLAYHHMQQSLYVGILEDAEIYQVYFPEKSLPQSEKIFSKPSSSISDLYLFRDELYFTLANQGDVYRMLPNMSSEGDYLTKVFDFNQIVRWGQVMVENHNPLTTVKVFSRSGNSQTPDSFLTKASVSNFENITPVESWSPWNEAEKGIKSPPNRFLQVKLELTSQRRLFNTHPFESDSALIKKVKIFFGQKNVPHRIKNLKIYKQKPNFLMSGVDQSQTQSSVGTFELYSADHSLNTVYSTEENALVPTLDPNTSLLPFPKVGKKEYILKWEAENLDQDNLVYAVYYRNYKSSSPQRWHKLRDHFIGTSLALDGYKFIDGVYQFKVVAEDSIQNQKDEVYRAEAVSVQQIFDNQSPKIEEVRWTGNTLHFKVTDNLSIIKSVKYTGDRQTVSLVIPIDGVYDEIIEEFSFQVEKGITELVIIVRDSADNIIYHNTVKE